MNSSDLRKMATGSVQREALERALGEIPPRRSYEERTSPSHDFGKKPSIRIPRARKMTPSEQEYGAMLRKEFPTARVDYQGITLHLPGGIRYRPDFAVWHGTQAYLIRIVEVKGKSAGKLRGNDRSKAAFKIAIEAFPMIRFRFAEKREDGTWATVETTSETSPRL